jgi:cholest-4-en-3-one 26-monooxygenase
VICELVGAPAGDRGRIFELSNKVAGFDDPEMAASPADQMQAVAEMYAYAGELADSRRKQPRDDIVTQLLQPDDAGQELTTMEFNFFFEPGPPHGDLRYRAERPAHR